MKRFAPGPFVVLIADAVADRSHGKKSLKSVATLASGVRSGLLAEIPVSELAGEKVWTLRVRAKHQGGRVREGRFRLVVGG